MEIYFEDSITEKRNENISNVDYKTIECAR